ncbi:MDR family MFS transporter [Gorillibacterium timonense]|uniref:MDR family MFS transporter n=1 Tax=Gorillibacterium timonense TaxID=1689269 RepID=UPI003709B931
MKSITSSLRSSPARAQAYLRDFHPVVHTLVLGTVLARAASSMSIPFLAIYLARYSDAGIVANSLIIGASSLAGTVGGFIGGTISDRIGRKTVMLSALFCWSLVFVGFGLAREPLAFVLLNLLNGLCRSFYEPVSQALMADLTPKEKRFKVFSMRYFAINVGVAVGPLAGAYFSTRNASLAFILTGVIYFLYAVVLQFLLAHFGIRRIEGDTKKEATFRRAVGVIRRDVKFRYFLVGAMIGSISYSQMNVTLSQYLDHSFTNGIGLFGTLISLNAITVILFQLPLTSLSSKKTPITSIAMGNVMFALGNLGYAFSHHEVAFMASMVVFTLGEILCFPAGNLLIDGIAPEGMRGTYFGAQSLQNIGQFLGPLLGGILLEQANGTILFSIMAVLTLSGTWFYVQGDRLKPAVALSASGARSPSSST